VYHANGSPTEGHHCKITATGTCTCRCNALFRGDYNPRDTDLFDHVIDSSLGLLLQPTVDEPTPQPTNWPTKAPTKSPTSSPTKAPTSSPTKAPTSSPTSSPTKAPTSYPTEAAPEVAELATHTATAETEVTLDGVTAAQFNDEVELAVQSAVADQYGVHVDQVTIEIVPGSGSGRRLTGGLTLKVTIQATAAKVHTVQQNMALIAAAPATDARKTDFAAVINHFIAEVAPTAQVTVVVAECSAPVVAQNVAVALYSAGFEDGADGWTCGAVTQCGTHGSVCGGFNQKGKLSTIQKTVTVVPGTYSIDLSFLKIDSWSVCALHCTMTPPPRHSLKPPTGLITVETHTHTLQGRRGGLRQRQRCAGT
jgi:hypothetical protein